MYKKILAGLQMVLLMTTPMTTFAFTVDALDDPEIIINSTKSITNDFEGTTSLQFEVVENSNFVASISARTSISEDALSEVVLTGPDESFFEIIDNEIRFSNGPDFENPQDKFAVNENSDDNDSDTVGNNVYRVGFRLSEGSTTAGVNINVTVIDEEERPIIDFNSGEDLELTVKDIESLQKALKNISDVYQVSYSGGGEVNLNVIFTAADNSGPLKPVYSTSYDSFPTDQSVEDILIDPFSDKFAPVGTHVFSIGITDGQTSDEQFITVNLQNTPPVIKYNNGEDVEVTAKTKEALVEKLSTISTAYRVSDFDGDTVSVKVSTKLSQAASILAGTSTVVTEYIKEIDETINIETELLSFVENEIATGTYIVTVEVSDGEDEAENGPQIITLNIENTAPVIEYNNGEDVEVVAKNKEVLLEQLIVINNSYIISDYDDDSVTGTTTIQLSNAAAEQFGTSTVIVPFQSEGDVQLDLAADLVDNLGDVVATGTYVFTIEATDGEGGDSVASQTIRVIVGNTPPVIEYNNGEDVEITAKTKKALLEQLVAISETYVISDFDNDEIKGTTTLTLPEQVAVVQGTSTIVTSLESTGDFVQDISELFVQLEAENMQDGIYVLTIEAQDEDGEVVSGEVQTIMVTIGNAPPVIEYNDGEGLDLQVKNLEDALPLLNAINTEFVISDFDLDTITATSTVILPDGVTREGQNSFNLEVQSNQEDESTINLPVEEMLGIFSELVVSTTTNSGVYGISIVAQDEDGVTTTKQVINISVTGETEPEFVSFAGASSTQVSLVEGQKVEITTEAIDEDGDSVQYFLSPESNSLFIVNATSGLVTSTSPNITPGEYVVVILVNDQEDIAEVEEIEGGETEQNSAENEDSFSDSQEITITVIEEIDTPESQTNGGGRGGSKYVCKDKEALNYKARGKSDSSLCKYAKKEPEVEIEKEEEKEEEEEEDKQVVQNPTNNQSNPANVQTASFVSAAQEQTIDEENVDNEEEVATEEQTQNVDVARPNQSANILGALSGGESCSVYDQLWYLVGIVGLLMGGLFARIFANPEKWLYKLVNNIGIISITALALLSLWVVFNGCWEMWYAPGAMVSSWIIALLTRDTQV